VFHEPVKVFVAQFDRYTWHGQAEISREEPLTTYLSSDYGEVSSMNIFI